MKIPETLLVLDDQVLQVLAFFPQSRSRFFSETLARRHHEFNEPRPSPLSPGSSGV
jgi:hypothetical protein